MDPLSIAASVITVVAAAGTVAKHLEELRNTLQHAPDVLNSLVNEVLDLRMVLEACDSAVHELHRDTHQAINGTPLADAVQILHRIKRYLGELDSLISACLDDSANASGIFKTARLRWVKVRNKAEKIQQQLRDSKQDFLMLIESQSVSAVSGMQIAVQEIS
ncbi:hypothetical protein K458DRAFT_390536 [Lentithecium fluviatile CBS 122367]|uniref:Azaphilone pigments biosynthesis cluster protein L N-terminal domain-containing protein n=1 Tax=Lentithecium fluviatile CBS 122367 TaxID=1168545 RepID=A0A6G1IXE2_9PLEO|nr:hypothetical protein K458DRAFT_390536 [Lentithecium fluviatile CBS 122367]